MTQAEKTYICEQIAAGRPVSHIIQDPEVKVSQRTVNEELHRDPYFLANYARAREAAIEPAQEEVEDILVGRGEWANVPFDVRKELANHRRWNAIRLQRFRYGDKIDVNANLKVVEGRVIDAEVLDLDQLMAVREALQIASGNSDDDEEDQ
jgi:hypothetical protein